MKNCPSNTISAKVMACFQLAGLAATAWGYVSTNMSKLCKASGVKSLTVKRTNKAVASLFLQHLADVANATDGELIVVELVS